MKKILLGSIIVLCIVLVALMASWISPYDPNTMSLMDRLQSPTLNHPLGLDENGSDVLSKLIYGSRISLGVAFFVVTVSGLFGLIVGSFAGYYGGWRDQVVMRVVDLFHAFPGFLIALAFAAMLGPSVRNLLFALSFTSWTAFARLVRGEVLHLREREHVQAARAIGAHSLRIMAFHIWPNLISLLIVQANFAMAATIIAESGLSFLGLGVPPSIPTWGSLLSSGRRFLSEAPHISFAPGVAIMLLVLGFNLLGDGLRDVLDPRRASLNKV